MAQNRLSPGAPDLYRTEKPVQTILRNILKVFIAGEEKASLETTSHCTLLPESTSKGTSPATSQGSASPGASKAGRGTRREVQGGGMGRGSPFSSGREAPSFSPTRGHGDALSWEVGAGGWSLLAAQEQMFARGWKSQSTCWPNEILATAGVVFQLDGSFER